MAASTSAPRTALISGGSSGIGLELAKLFAGDGYRLVLVAHNAEKLKAAADGVRKAYGVEVVEIALNLEAPDAVNTIVSTLDAQGIEVDALVNDAGFGISGTFVKTSWPKQKAMLDLNIDVLTELTLEYGARMAQRGSGEILNVASIAAFMAGPYMATYYASKAYVLEFTSAVHGELRKAGVKVSAVCPPPTKTDFFRKAGDGAGNIFNSLAMSAAGVARCAYRGLKLNRTFTTPGLFTKVTVFATRLLPRPVMRGIIGLIQRPAGVAADKKRAEEAAASAASATPTNPATPANPATSANSMTPASADEKPSAAAAAANPAPVDAKTPPAAHKTAA